MNEGAPLLEPDTGEMKTRSRRCVALVLWYIDVFASWVLRPEVLLVLVVLITLFTIIWHQVLSVFVDESSRYAIDSGMSLPGHGPGHHLEGYKFIMIWAGCFGHKDCGWGGTSYLFRTHSCPEDRCMVISDHRQIDEAELVVFHVRDIQSGLFKMDIPSHHDPKQVWVFFSHEAPYNTYLEPALLSPWFRDLSYLDNMFNATMTYMTESDFFLPYYTYTSRVTTAPSSELVNIPNKSALLLWVVSNCHSDSRRMQYVDKLKKHIKLDIYGKCGEPHPCDKLKLVDDCFNTFLKKYKFYLAFENAECRDYVTEKFWRTLKSGVVPVVLGAYAEDYANLAPPNSYIHVDQFTGPQKLAEYLKYLDANDTAYNEYLKWHEDYEIISGGRSGRLGGTHSHTRLSGLCQMCAVAHNKSLLRRQTYKVSDWFSVKRLCHTT